MWRILHSNTKFNLEIINPLNANTTKWSNTLKQFVGNVQRIASVCLTISLGSRLEG